MGWAKGERRASKGAQSHSARRSPANGPSLALLRGCERDSGGPGQGQGRGGGARRRRRAATGSAGGAHQIAWALSSRAASPGASAPVGPRWKPVGAFGANRQRLGRSALTCANSPLKGAAILAWQWRPTGSRTQSGDWSGRRCFAHLYAARTSGPARSGARAARGHSSERASWQRGAPLWSSLFRRAGTGGRGGPRPKWSIMATS